MLCLMGNSRSQSYGGTGRVADLAWAPIGNILDVRSPLNSALHDDDRLLDRDDDQAAAADPTCRQAGSFTRCSLWGRFRCGIGVGWNPVEYVGLNENAHNRGNRSKQQVELIAATFKGQWHTIDRLRQYVTEARDPNWVWVSTGEGGPDDWRRRFQAWKDADVTHVSVNNSYDRGAHKRIAGKTLVHQLAAMTSDRETFANLA